MFVRYAEYIVASDQIYLFFYYMIADDTIAIEINIGKINIIFSIDYRFVSVI